MSRPRIPLSLRQNPLIRHWVDFSKAGVARVFSAKVELGQGILTALAQIAAEELHIPLEKIEVVSGDTRCSPDESYTAGSMSIEVGGASLRMACAAAREAMLAEAARILEVDRTRLDARDGAIVLDGAESGLDFWAVAPRVNWDAPVGEEVPTGASLTSRHIGKSIARLDLPSKVTGGGAFVHDLELPGMVHARVLRPPHPRIHIADLDHADIEKMPGVVKVWRSGDFVGVCCEREYQAVKAIEKLRGRVRWTEDPGLPAGGDWKQWLWSLPAVDSRTEMGSADDVHGDLIRHSASYSKPPIAHASIGPSCAVARFDGGELSIWTHSQGVFPLRAALATALGLDQKNVVVRHVQGAGCYGHNGADDVAYDAAVLAMQVAPRPVRVQWTREDEFMWAPLGSPMAIKIDAAITPGGEIAEWASEIWSGPHGRRPNLYGVGLLGAAQVAPPIDLPVVAEDVNWFAGGSRNSEPPYELLHRRIVLHSIAEIPFRTSSLRTLGGYANVFAMESFIDELAERAGLDPVALRLRNIIDPRARRVIETAARMAGWDEHAPRGAGAAMGMGFSRYKTTAAYVAVVARVETADRVRVTDVFCAVDAGLAINPDGIINQIEGGIVQAISWTLFEEVRFTPEGPAIRTWDDYPILRFADAPPIRVELIQHHDSPSLGVGEAAHGPTAAAIANAVARALDCRIRDLPITRERIIGALTK